jgi:hypothetical protein
MLIFNMPIIKKEIMKESAPGRGTIIKAQPSAYKITAV